MRADPGDEHLGHRQHTAYADLFGPASLCIDDLGTYTVPMHLVTRVGADVSNLWYFENISGTMTFSFVAHP